ncbi:MAG: hypothetical protein H0T73_10230 [Ardenticatenales bacterium]|nr:hypothetical protein [Ardenticatenales bacterium]
MVGILWMDDSEVEIAQKIKEAAQRYRSRFGEAATLCYANAKDVPEATTINGISVEPRLNILRHHFLVGRKTAEEKVVGRKTAGAKKKERAA